MSKSNLKLVLSKPEGFKVGVPLTQSAKLVNPETGEEVPGLGNVTLQIPAKGGMLRCNAEINLSGIEIAEQISVATDSPVAGKSTVDIAAK